MGGISGLIYSSLPVVVFVPVSTAFGLMPAIGAALGVAALILVWRLIRRESIQPAISGFFGVGISALIAYVVGESKGYFLLGIWMSLLWAVVFALSILVRRPAVGYIWGWVNSHDRDWRGVRKAVVAFAARGSRDADLVRAINHALILVADHELNVSAFAARVAASAGAGRHSSNGIDRQ